MTSRKFSGRFDPKFNPFADSYLAEILKATAVAWARMKQPARKELEDPITRRLAGRLSIDPHFAELPYFIVPQFWLLNLDGRPLGRLDLYFRHRNSQRAYFAFEAKRLHVTYPSGISRTEYSTYAGKDGMMAFVDGYYSTGLAACGMAGYVMDGKSDVAWIGLGKVIAGRRTPLKLTGSYKLEISALAKTIVRGASGTYLGETAHDLGSHHLRIFHLILPVMSRRKSKTT